MSKPSAPVVAASPAPVVEPPAIAAKLSPFEVITHDGHRLPVWTSSGRVPLRALLSMSPIQSGEQFGAPPAEALKLIAERKAALFEDAAALLAPAEAEAATKLADTIAAKDIEIAAEEARALKEKADAATAPMVAPGEGVAVVRSRRGR